MEGYTQKIVGGENPVELESSKPVIPIQYEGMHPDAVDIAWTVPSYIDPNKTTEELARKEHALQHLRSQEETEEVVNESDKPEAETIENLRETDPSLEQFLEQPNVLAAQEELRAILSNEGAVDTEAIKNILYSLLTKRAWLFTELEKRGSKDLTWMMEDYKPHREWYRDTLANMESQFTQNGFETASNPAWFSVTASERQSDEKQHASHKVYETINLNDYSKITELPKLVQELKVIGDEMGESIKIKIPGNFNGFMTHNDSLVVHCDSAEACQKAQQAIATWKTNQGLSPVERELNRATIAMDGKTESSDGEKESFSQLVASQIAAWAEEHSSNYPAEIMASEAIKHTILLAQKTPQTTTQ